MKKVYNGPIARIFRTLGYFLVAISSLVSLTLALSVLNFGFLQNIVNPIYDVLVNDLKFLVEFQFLISIVGILLLVWTLGKRMFTKIFVTLVTIFVTLGMNTYISNVFGFNISIEFLDDLYMKLFELGNWIPLVMASVMYLLVYVVISGKKPSRISNSFIGTGIFIFLLSAVFASLSIFSDAEFLVKPLFINIVLGVEAIGELLMLIGSVFGVIGLFRK